MAPVPDHWDVDASLRDAAVRSGVMTPAPGATHFFLDPLGLGPVEKYNPNQPRDERGRWTAYHGTNLDLKPGDLILPPSETGAKQTFDPPNPHYRPDLVYFTSSLSSAKRYGEHVYEVEPIGNVEKDPETANMPGWDVDYRAPRARVVRRLDVEKHGGASHDQSSHGNWARRARGDKSPSRDDYGGVHSPPSDGPPLHDLHAGNGWFPDDVYETLHHYGHEPGGGGRYDRESIEVVRRVRGNPEAPVTIYRAVPPHVDRINTGDWVAISRSYAEQHAEAMTTGPPWKVLSTTVPARLIRNGGNDIVEWGYWGDSTVAKYNPNQPRIPAGQPGGGRWTDGTAVMVPPPGMQATHGAKPKWSPTMTREDAEHWANDSVIQDVLTHTTHRSNLNEEGGILRDGFKPSSGGVFGPGIYLGSEPLEVVHEGLARDADSTALIRPEYLEDRQAREYAWGSDRETAPTLRVKVDVRKPFVVDLPSGDLAFRHAPHVWVENAFEDMMGWQRGQLRASSERNVYQELRARGYDALVIRTPGTFEWSSGGDQVVVWDPKKVTVIVDESGQPEDYRFRKYNPNQPRDERGRWTEVGSNTFLADGNHKRDDDLWEAGVDEAEASLAEYESRNLEDFGSTELSEPSYPAYQFWASTFENVDLMQQAAVNLWGAASAMPLKDGTGYTPTDEVRAQAYGYARHVMRAIERDASPETRPLYRGINLSDIGDLVGPDAPRQIKDLVGRTLNLGLSAFSPDYSTASSFADGSLPGSQKVVFRTRGPVNTFFTPGWENDEQITAGRFKVVGYDYDALTKTHDLVIEQEAVFRAP